MTPIEALNSLPLAVWLRSSPWAYPALEVTHILGIATMLGSVFLVDFKILLAPKKHQGPGIDACSAHSLSKFAVKYTVLGFGLIICSGSCMLFARLADLIGNPALLWKMGFITLAFSNAVFLHLREGLSKLDALSRLQAFLSILLWAATVTAGRWIAYV